MGKLGALLIVAVGLLASACNTTESVQFTALANQTAIVRDGLPAIISRKSWSIVLVRPAGRGRAPEAVQSSSSRQPI